ncbi:hypothetical protein C1645_873652 [Glomus cerebriforme]|uniref:Protein kinase domain-containing protein n=1 Tax=Glomus cerebriforme TaxID=658196 RepID=A0A397TGY3_9GLOM|nr:hypothetical protein C1645_873652 [Glomus cerebriforme]
MTKIVKAYLESYFLTGNMNRTDRMTAKNMVEQLQIIVDEGEIQADDVPEITTVASWITRYAASLKKQTAVEKVAEGSSNARNANNFQEMAKSSSEKSRSCENPVCDNSSSEQVTNRRKKMERVNGHQFLLLTREKLFADPYKFPGELIKDLAKLINELNNQKQALSCVPLPIGYHPNVNTSQGTSDSGKSDLEEFGFEGTTYSSDQFPMEIHLWDDLFEEVNKFHFDNEPKFQRPQFGNFPFCINEEDICNAFYCNICQILNILLPNYEFSKQPVPITGIPDFSATFVSFEFIVPIEISREHIFQLLLLDGEQTFLYFDETNEYYEMNEHARNVIQQIFTYMAEAQLYFADFKYKNILGQGRSRKTLLCEFCENTIALKNYGFYDRIYYAIDMTLVSSALNNYKHIIEWQRVIGLLALNAIYDRGVLHNDIHEENILLDDTNDIIFLIDFGMARYHCDAKKIWRLFNKEKYKLIRLLDHYTLLNSVIVIE